MTFDEDMEKVMEEAERRDTEIIEKFAAHMAVFIDENHPNPPEFAALLMAARDEIVFTLMKLDPSKKPTKKTRKAKN